MSRKFKSQASSARAASTTFGSQSFGFGSTSTGFQTSSSLLSYVAETPDLAAISDPQVVVSFKNLTKKDNVTKAKALEELQQYVTSVQGSGGTLENSIIETWTTIYPRLSIENARRVRQLAHVLQGSLTTFTGKRIAPHLPKVIGPWLAGLFDVDRSVSKAARDSFESSFATEQKRENVWKIYQTEIVSFVEDATTSQTPQTLSDERTTSPDDAEAKHVRLVGTALLVLDRLIATRAKTNKNTKAAHVDDLLASKKLWEYAHHADPFPRRGSCILLQTCLLQEPDTLDWSTLSTCFLAKALHISHIGSALLYTETLAKASEARPTIWTSDYSAKTSCTKRLFQFLRNGSQKGPDRVWIAISDLLKRIPIPVWSSETMTSAAEPSVTVEGVAALLEALKEGVTAQEEPRSNLTVAWNTYTEIGRWAIDKLKGDQEAHLIVDKHIFPLVEQYVNASPNNPKWTIPVRIAPTICGGCLCWLYDRYQTRVTTLLKNLSGQLLDQMKLSLPEQSKDFRSSQDSVLSHSRRMLAVLANASEAKSQTAGGNRDSICIFEDEVALLLHGAIQLLRDRNGKPYGVAGFIELAVRNAPSLVINAQQQRSKQELARFLNEDVPKLLDSPSADLLISTALLCDEKPGFEDCLNAIIKTLLARETSPESSALRQILKNINAAKLKKYPELESHMSQNITSALRGDTAKWDDLQHFLGSQAELSEARDRILSDIIGSLRIEETQEGAFNGIELLLRQSSSFFKATTDSGRMGNLILALQDLSYSGDETAERAAALNQQLKRKFDSSNSNAMWRLLAPLVQEQLSSCSAHSVSVQALADLGKELIEKTSQSDRNEMTIAIVPSAKLWTQVLSDFIHYGPFESHAITSILQGTVYSIESASFDEDKIYAYRKDRDLETFSPLARLTYYAVKILKSSEVIDEMDPQLRRSLFLCLPQSLQFLEDKLDDPAVNEAWNVLTPTVEIEMAELVSEGRNLLKDWISEQAHSESSGLIAVESCWQEQLEELTGDSASTYNRGVAFSMIMSQCISITGVQKYAFSWEQKLKSVHISSNVVQSACLIVVCGDWLGSSPVGKRLCNELVAGLMEPYAKNERTFVQRLLLFNLLVWDEDTLLGAIPQHRLVVFVKHLMDVLQNTHGAPSLEAELLKATCNVVGFISDVFGEHWQQMLAQASKCIGNASGPQDTLPSLNAGLRLLLRLKSCIGKETNDDLEDAWEEMLPNVSRALLESLQCNNAFMSEIDQTMDGNSSMLSEGRSKARSTTLDLLGRTMRKLEVFDVEDSLELLPLLAAEEKAIQDAAFDILHHSIPQKQEKISFDVALSRTIVHLPEELLSLLLDMPSEGILGSLAQSSTSVFLGVRRYLLSWKIVFDHFTNASYKVRETYVNDIKESEHLNRFLDFAVDVLRINAKPLDASKFDVTKFEINDSETSEHEITWMVIHLYYLSLRHLSTLTRSWWINSRNRIKTPLETWTDKHITPLITSSAVAGVTDWASTLDQSEERPLQIKASPNRSELVASIVIDEENPAISIAISLPRSYPFQPANVSSRHRVGVDEKKWQSWLRTIQIIILTSNSLIDGLLAFRRNVLGALKGQTECAICYSVIGQDMKTPDKPCKTCKNNFHSVCLFRWFKSSSSSTCPLCRNNFNYA